MSHDRSTVEGWDLDEVLKDSWHVKHHHGARRVSGYVREVEELPMSLK